MYESQHGQALIMNKMCLLYTNYSGAGNLYLVRGGAVTKVHESTPSVTVTKYQDLDGVLIQWPSSQYSLRYIVLGAPYD